MLRPIQQGRSRQRGGGRFAIIASQYNARFVDGMLRAARAVLKQAKVDQVLLVRVPGAFEIPVVAAKLASQRELGWAGLICLGVILRGATTHAQHIGESVSAALAQIQITYHVPVIHEVLLLENEGQARERCLSLEHNRGAEAAQTALQMATILRQLERQLGQGAGVNKAAHEVL